MGRASQPASVNLSRQYDKNDTLYSSLTQQIRPQNVNVTAQLTNFHKLLKAMALKIHQTHKASAYSCQKETQQISSLEIIILKKTLTYKFDDFMDREIEKLCCVAI